MKKTCQLNSRGQITLPKTVRDVLNLKEEDFLDLEIDTKNQSVKLTKSTTEINPLNNLLDLIKYFITLNKDLIILVQGPSGVGKSYFSQLLIKHYLEYLDVEVQTEGHPCDWDFSNQEHIVLEDESYGIGLVKELKDKPTIITNQQLIKIEQDSLLKKSNRPILSIEFSHFIKYIVDTIKFYPNITKSNDFILLQNTPMKIHE